MDVITTAHSPVKLLVDTPFFEWVFFFYFTTKTLTK